MMLRRHRYSIAMLFLLCDLFVTSGVWFASYFVRFGVWDAPQGVPRLWLVVQGLPIVLALAALAYRLCGMYEVHRLRRWASEAEVVCVASGLLFLLTTTVTFYRRDLYESRLALGLFLVLNAAALIVARRTVWRILQSPRRRPLAAGRAIIISAGRAGRRVADTLENNTWAGLQLVGFVDKPGKLPPGKAPLLGDIDQLARVVQRNRIDHVFIALPLHRYSELPAIYKTLSDVLVEVQLVPDVPNLSGMRVRTLDIDDVPFLSLRENPHVGWRRLAKRGMDLALGSLALLGLAPFMALLAVLVKLTSRGPVFFRQPRAGLGGRDFQMLKFRSMRSGAERETGPVWASKNDDRCTPLGRFMRRWSLDELPQLFNVLAGDMSLVGPRPERGVFIDKFRQQIPNYAQRHQVKAGITGWAQVHGWRGNTSLRRRIECDLYYICNWSLLLDLKILCMTLWCGFRNRNAY